MGGKAEQKAKREKQEAFHGDVAACLRLRTLWSGNQLVSDRKGARLYEITLLTGGIIMKPLHLVSLILAVTCLVSSTVLADHLFQKVILLDDPIDGVRANRKSRKEIRTEMCSTNFSGAIARKFGLETNQAVWLEAVPDQGAHTDLLRIHFTELTEKEMEPILLLSVRYARERERGHSMGFLMEAMTNASTPATATNIFFRVISENHPLVPFNRLEKTEEAPGALGSFPPAWTKYRALDADLLWIYYVESSTGPLSALFSEECHDAQEANPDLQSVFKEVDAEVGAKMKRAGTAGKFGSIHEFWALRKAKLKQRGIEWRSPGELNPNTVYD